MVSFDAFTIEDGSPIYLQIILYVKRCIIGGTIADGDELPSRRAAVAYRAVLHVPPRAVHDDAASRAEDGLDIVPYRADGGFLALRADRDRDDTLHGKPVFNCDLRLHVQTAETVSAEMLRDSPREVVVLRHEAA